MFSRRWPRFLDCLCQTKRQVGKYGREAGYGLILTLQLLAIWYTQSRGPMLALGIGFLAFAISLWRFRSLWWSPGILLQGLFRTALCLLAGLGLGGTIVSIFGLFSHGGTGPAPWWFPLCWLVLCILSLGGMRLSRQPWRTLLPISLFWASLVIIFSLGFGLRESVSHPPGTQIVQDLWSTAESTLGRQETVRQRTLYWQGYSDAYFSELPVSYLPDGSTSAAGEERLHHLRALLGLGRRPWVWFFDSTIPSLWHRNSPHP